MAATARRADAAQGRRRRAQAGTAIGQGVRNEWTYQLELEYRNPWRLREGWLYPKRRGFPGGFPGLPRMSEAKRTRLRAEKAAAAAAAAAVAEAARAKAEAAEAAKREATLIAARDLKYRLKYRFVQGQRLQQKLEEEECVRQQRLAQQLQQQEQQQPQLMRLGSVNAAAGATAKAAAPASGSFEGGTAGTATFSAAPEGKVAAMPLRSQGSQKGEVEESSGQPNQFEGGDAPGTPGLAKTKEAEVRREAAAAAADGEKAVTPLEDPPVVAKAKTDIRRVRRAFQNASTEDMVRRIALAALLRSQHEFLAPFDTLPQQLLQERVVDCLDFLSSPSGVSLGRSAYLDWGRTPNTILRFFSRTVGRLKSKRPSHSTTAAAGAVSGGKPEPHQQRDTASDTAVSVVNSLTLPPRSGREESPAPTATTSPPAGWVGTAPPRAVMSAAPKKAAGGQENEGNGEQRGEGGEKQALAEPPLGPKPDDSSHVSASRGSGGLSLPAASVACVQATTAKEEVAPATGTASGRNGNEVRIIGVWLAVLGYASSGTGYNGSLHWE